MTPRERFVDFIQHSLCFDTRAKLRLILFIVGKKAATFVPLKVTPDRIEEKAHFEQHLRELGFLYDVSRAKSFEEIRAIKGGEIRWEIKGTWYGYDLFESERERRRFHQYTRFLRNGQHAKADKVAGTLYGYPPCCTQAFIREEQPSVLKQTYTCYQFFKKRRDLARTFPFVMHTPCARTCRRTALMNAQYRLAIRKHAPLFSKSFTTQRAVRTELIVESESDVFEDQARTRSLWLEKDGREYRLVSRRRINGKYVLIPLLTRNHYEEGTVLSAKVLLRHDFPTIVQPAVVDFVGPVSHRRKLLPAK